MAYPPEPDEGQPGLVLLSTGAYGYRYIGSDDVIIMKMPASPTPGDEQAET